MSKTPIPAFRDLPSGLLADHRTTVVVAAATDPDGTDVRDAHAAAESLLFSPAGQLLTDASLMGLFEAYVEGFVAITDGLPTVKPAPSMGAASALGFLTHLRHYEPVWAACEARKRNIHGDIEYVRQFTTDLLELKPTPTRLEAVRDALLDLTDDDLLNEGNDVIRWLRARVRRRHRAVRFLTETAVGGRAILSLDADCKPGGWSLHDLAADRFDRVDAVLRRLDAQHELAVVRASFDAREWRIVLLHHDGRTWGEASAEAGAEDPHREGERVGRKFRRVKATLRPLEAQPCPDSSRGLS